MLGEVPNDKEVEKQIAKLRTLYFDRYKNAWRIFIQDLEAARPLESTSSLDQLNALSEPEWPYLRLLRTLAENTALIEEDPTLLQKFTDKVVDKAENKLDKMAAKLEGKPAPKPDAKTAPPRPRWSRRTCRCRSLPSLPKVWIPARPDSRSIRTSWPSSWA